MKRLIPAALSAMALATAALVGSASADYVVYYLPKSGKGLILEGKAHKGNGTWTVMHRYGEMVFENTDVDVYPVPKPVIKIHADMKAAQKNGDCDALLALSAKAIRSGEPEYFMKAMNEIQKIDAEHKPSAVGRRIRERLRSEIPVTDAEEKAIRNIVKEGDMKVLRSEHFIMLTDVTKRSKGSRESRAHERLKLMENVYIGFMGLFASRGVELVTPRERMMTVYYADRKDFRSMASSLHHNVEGLLGFFQPDINCSFFFDFESDDGAQFISGLAKDIKDLLKEKQREGIWNVKKLARASRMFDVMAEVYRERQDVEVVTHEATHQIAANSKLFPRDVYVPRWVHEGLACYFEAPRDVAWSGVGTVADDRLDQYAGMKDDKEHCHVDFIMSDKTFKLAANTETMAAAYGPSWALVHFLLERHFEKTMKYFRLLGSIPKKRVLSGDEYSKLFDSVFPKSEREKLNSQWHAYMDTLKTDFEIVVGKSKRRAGGNDD